jgi:hypothetical protein
MTGRRLHPTLALGKLHRSDDEGVERPGWDEIRVVTAFPLSISIGLQSSRWRDTGFFVATTNLGALGSAKHSEVR